MESEVSHSSLSTGTYEVIRGRLRDAANDLRGRFEKLNQARASVFGNIETKLLSTVHVTTDHNCVPRDLVAVGENLLLGYNVQFGLKTSIHPSDVFSFYRVDDESAHQLDLRSVLGSDFERDFQEIYRYYKNTRFARFYQDGPLLYFVFQVGRTAKDIKALKWSIEKDHIRYIDSRSDHEVREPEPFAFQWTRTTREQHRGGLHPHISINDIVFVECVGGDLTIKIEDNTEDGTGVYAEPVDNPDQTLDDAEIFYCILGNLLLLKIRPYQERDFRFFVYSLKRQSVTRLDALAKSCVLLPDDHGIIFPGGFFLQTGIHKLFDHGLEGLRFSESIAAQNGEDYLYLFFDPNSGTYLQLRYNLIRQEVETPLVTHGQSFFVDGRMITFRREEQPQKHHALQLWKTPYVGSDFEQEIASDSMLFKIGNKELVRGMAECQELLQLIDKDDSYEGLYVDIEKRATDLLDSYFWIDRDETMRLSEPIRKVREAGATAVEEFEKVVRVRKETENAFAQVESDWNRILSVVNSAGVKSVDDFVRTLADMRSVRGEMISLRDRKFIDLVAVEQLESQVDAAHERFSLRCVQFLLSPDALKPYSLRITEEKAKISSIRTAADGRELQADLAKIGDDLELLIETISQLQIDDLTQRTAIVDRTADLLAELNRGRAELKAFVRELLSSEMEADFSSQAKLLDQTVSGALETADTPERIDEALTRTMLQLEELEGRFAEFDELLERLTEKRESIYSSFESKRQQLTEARARRADSLAAAAERILQGIQSKANRQSELDKLRSYLASDPMVAKVRQLADQLGSLGDTVRMDDVLTRLKSIADDASRQLQDRNELFTDGENTIRLGKHAFSVNRQTIELTTVVRNDALSLHLIGTQFFQQLSSPDIDSASDLWGQSLPSESSTVYRAEFLAHDLMRNWNSDEIQEFVDADESPRIEMIRSAMQSRHEEGYVRGVHDHDTALILERLIEFENQLQILRHSPMVRGLTRFVWQTCVPQEIRTRIIQWIRSLATLKNLLPQIKEQQVYVRRISIILLKYGKHFFDSESVPSAASYLFDHLLTAEDAARFRISHQSATLVADLESHVGPSRREAMFQAVQLREHRPRAAWTLATDAVRGFILEQKPELHDELNWFQFEAAAQLLLKEPSTQIASPIEIASLIPSLAGDHARIRSSNMVLNFYEFEQRLGAFHRETLPRFHSFRAAKKKLLEKAEADLRTRELRPRVLTSFVRNQLIDEVYLPLIGDNFAKQLGSSGDTNRTDRMGMLLLISPPGYGKTTLMEYIANRFGLIFVKINGPAIGHGVTSLDPQEATNAAAREEVERINLALEMGDNVMLYLDDIQHCNPELLQKFIPLCDATRRIEGVWNGNAKTYDLRGRKFAVVMAGNPYTESGTRFQIPDMLSNRADVYNLGEIIGDSEDAFELSYLENCLTSNPALIPLTKLSGRDQRALLRAVENQTTDMLSLEGNLNADELRDIIAVVKRLIQVRDIVLKVNRAYIQSAAQADAYRTEPPFKLQGSYRNMNRIAERVVPVMNEEELQNLILSSYEQESQTLTQDGESNLLKFKSLLGVLDKDEIERWEAIRKTYSENVRLQGIGGDDATAQVLRAMASLRMGLDSIGQSIADAMSTSQDSLQSDDDSLVSSFGQLLDKLTKQLETVLEHSALRNEKEPRVLVQHSVPRVLTDLIQAQMQLIHDGLQPLIGTVAESNQQYRIIERRIEECLDKYRAVQLEINKDE